MKKPDIPDNESERLQAIDRIDILDTPPEGVYDDFTRLAALVCNTQFSTVSIVDEQRQWFKSIQGPLETRETSRDVSFCGHALNSPELFIIEDAHEDERFADNPLVQEGPRIRFYAGAPIVLADGVIVGTLCVFDPQPNTLDDRQKEALALLAKQVTERLQNRIANAIAENLDGILALGDTNLIVFDPVQEQVNYISPGLQKKLAGAIQLDTRPLFAQLFPDITYNRFFARERLNDSELAHRKITRVCLPDRSPGRAELRLFKTGISDRRICILGFRDRTELARTRESAEQAQSDLRVFHELARQSKNAFIVTGADGKTQWVNSSFETMTGFLCSEMIGKTPGEVLQGPETSALDNDRIERHLRAKRPVVQEILNYTKSGRPFWVELYIEPIVDEAGSVTHFVSTQKDVTQRRQETSVLKESRASAEQASRAKSEFLAKISHELRTPLNGIIGITEKLLHEVPDSLTTSALTLDRSAQHLMAMLDDLLDLSQIESGELVLDYTAFNVADLLKGVCHLFSQGAELVGARMTLDIRPDLPAWIEGDAVRLKQVLINLVSNAVKFTRKGEVRVTAAVIEGAPRTDEMPTIRFSVTDDGPGIAAEDRLRVFESFEQLDNSATRTHGGSGLGLAISKQLVEAMGGRIDLDSEPGKGTTFFFEIPFSVSPAPLENTSTTNQRVDTHRKTLDYALVIDDNLTNCKVLDNLLTRSGCSIVQVAQSARRAIAILANVQPDVVFIDLQMPDISGIELMIMLQHRFAEQNRTLPVTVACTADVSDAKRKECLSAGFDAHLGKPVTGASFYGLMGKLGLSVKNPDATYVDTRDNRSEQSQALPAQEDQIIDRDSLMVSFLGNEGLLKEFLSLLTENLPVHIHRIQGALQTGVITSHSDAAHSIKGLVGYFRSEALIKDAEDLENAMKRGDAKEARSVYKALKPKLHALGVEAKALLKS